MVSVIVRVSTFIEPVKFALAELVMVMVPMSVPTAPVTMTALVVLMVKLLTVPAAVPVTAARLIALAMPVPTVRVTLSARVALPRSILPVVAPPTVASAVTETPVLPPPRVMVLVPVVAAIVPAMLTEEGAVAVTPSTKVVLSAASLPRVTVPVFRKVVVPAMLLMLPVMATL